MQYRYSIDTVSIITNTEQIFVLVITNTGNCIGNYQYKEHFRIGNYQYKITYVLVIIDNVSILYRYCIDKSEDLNYRYKVCLGKFYNYVYRYSIDTVSIQYR